MLAQGRRRQETLLIPHLDGIAGRLVPPGHRVINLHDHVPLQYLGVVQSLCDVVYRAARHGEDRVASPVIYGYDLQILLYQRHHWLTGERRTAMAIAITDPNVWLLAIDLRTYSFQHATDFGAGAVGVVVVEVDLAANTLTCLNLLHKRIYEALSKGVVVIHRQVAHH